VAGPAKWMKTDNGSRYPTEIASNTIIENILGNEQFARNEENVAPRSSVLGCSSEHWGYSGYRACSLYHNCGTLQGNPLSVHHPIDSILSSSRTERDTRDCWWFHCYPESMVIDVERATLGRRSHGNNEPSVHCNLQL